ncbi:organic cation transporter protein [Trichonephila clavipes]|nr:organic cation transporter protein [Trichonephila clavipes]
MLVKSVVTQNPPIGLVWKLGDMGSSSGIVLVTSPWFKIMRVIPESPRWLLIKGKTDKLEKLLIKAAAINRREIKEGIKNLEMFKSGIEEEEKEKQTLWEVVKIPKLRNRAFSMIYIWIVNAFLYYGLSYNTNDLAGNPYLNFFLAGLLEFPSYVLVFWSIKKWGRRPTLVTLMLVGGVTYAADLPVPKDLPWISTSLALMGKFCVTGSFGLVYLYTAEIFPTGVRNVTLGSCSMWARVGSILAPFMRDLWCWARTRDKANHDPIPIPLGYRSHFCQVKRKATDLLSPSVNFLNYGRTLSLDRFNLHPPPLHSGSSVVLAFEPVTLQNGVGDHNPVFLKLSSAVFCFTASIDSNRVPFKADFIFGNKQKSHGAKSGEYGTSSSTGVRLSANTVSHIARYGQVSCPGAKSPSCSSTTRPISYKLDLAVWLTV